MKVEVTPSQIYKNHTREQISKHVSDSGYYIKDFRFVNKEDIVLGTIGSSLQIYARGLPNPSALGFVRFVLEPITSTSGIERFWE